VNLAPSLYLLEGKGSKVAFLSLLEGFLISDIAYRVCLYTEDRYIRILEVKSVMSDKKNVSGKKTINLLNSEITISFLRMIFYA
jgi:hypothetical protein